MNGYVSLGLVLFFFLLLALPMIITYYHYIKYSLHVYSLSVEEQSRYRYIAGEKIDINQPQYENIAGEEILLIIE